MKKPRPEFRDGYVIGFAMCLPECFKPALESEMFHVGDTIYDSPKAYEGTWADALRNINHVFQVTSTTKDRVGFDVYAPNEERTNLTHVQHESRTQSDFIDLLRTGIPSNPTVK